MRQFKYRLWKLIYRFSDYWSHKMLLLKNKSQREIFRSQLSANSWLLDWPEVDKTYEGAMRKHYYLKHPVARYSPIPIRRPY